MRKIVGLLLLLGILSACSPNDGPADNPYVYPKEQPSDNPGGKDDPDSPAPVSKYGFDYAAVAKSAHPRLMMTEDDFNGLKQRVLVKKDASDVLYREHQCAMAMAGRQVAESTAIVYKKDGGRLQTYARMALQRLFVLSYAYKVTSEKKYLDKVKSDMAAVLKFPDWNPGHYLDVAELSLAVAIAYDWLYDSWTEDERAQIEKALINNALGTCAGATYHESLGNWNQVCTAGITAAALAVLEKDIRKYSSIVETSVEENRTAMDHIYAPDGNDPEGYAYWDYGTSFEVIYLQMLQTAFGNCASLDKVAGFNKTGTYNLYLNGSVYTFSFCDGGGTRKATMRTAMWWLAGQFGRPQDLSFEMYLLNANRTINTNNRMFPSVPVFIYKHPLDVSSCPFPSEKLWIGAGCCPVAMFKIGWKNDGTDTFVGIKGGGAGTAHPHLDSGSFVFDLDGVRWSDDPDIGSYTVYEKAFSGFSEHSQKSLRWDVMRTNNLFHSTLAFYNEDSYLGSSKLHVTDQVAEIDGDDVFFTESYENGNEVSATLDMTKAYQGQVGSAVRTITLVSGKDLYVTDKIKAKPSADAVMEWRMLTQSTCVIAGSGINILQNGKKMGLTVASDDAAVVPEYKVWPATRPSEWADRGWNTGVEPALTGYSVVGYAATVPAGKTVTFTTKLIKNQYN